MYQRNNQVTTIFQDKLCIVEEGQFPTLHSMNYKINGMLIGIRGNGVVIEGQVEAQRNIANGYDPETMSHEIFKHEPGEKEALKQYRRKFKHIKLNTLYFSSADFTIAFGNPSQESTNICNWMKGKRKNLLN